MSYPVRGVVLLVEDPDTKEVVPVKLVSSPEGLALLPASIEADSAGLAKDATLSGIKAQTDKLTFDANNRLAIQDPPSMDVLLSTRASESTLSGVKTNLDNIIEDASSGMPAQLKNFHLRAPDAVVPSGEVWFVPSGNLYAFKTLTVSGYMRCEGNLKIKESMDVKDGTFDAVDGTVDVGWA